MDMFWNTKQMCAYDASMCDVQCLSRSANLPPRIIFATIKAFFHILAFNIEMRFSFFLKAISTRDPTLALDTPPPLATNPTYLAKEKSVLRKMSKYLSKCQRIPIIGAADLFQNGVPCSFGENLSPAKPGLSTGGGGVGGDAANLQSKSFRPSSGLNKRSAKSTLVTFSSFCKRCCT